MTAISATIHMDLAEGDSVHLTSINAEGKMSISVRQPSGDSKALATATLSISELSALIAQLNHIMLMRIR